MLFTDLTDSPATAVRCYDNRGLDDPAGGRLALSDSPAQRPSAGFAEVEIYVNASLPAITGGPGHFEIAFSARRFYWEYYLVTNLHDGTAGFRLEYTRAAAGDTPILFTHQPVADRQNKLLSILTAQYPDTQCIHFVSQEAVVCRSAARKNLRLLLNNDPLLDYLPNPALHNFSRHAVTDSAGSKTHDSLFQIVRYITHPFTTSGI
jgi:hypothetical protein